MRSQQRSGLMLCESQGQGEGSGHCGCGKRHCKQSAGASVTTLCRGGNTGVLLLDKPMWPRRPVLDVIAQVLAHPRHRTHMHLYAPIARVGRTRSAGAGIRTCSAETATWMVSPLNWRSSVSSVSPGFSSRVQGLGGPSRTACQRASRLHSSPSGCKFVPLSAEGMVTRNLPAMVV